MSSVLYTVLYSVFVAFYLISFYMLAKHSYRRGYYKATNDWLSKDPFPSWIKPELRGTLSLFRSVLHSDLPEDREPIELSGPIPGWEKVNPSEVTLSEKAQCVDGVWYEPEFSTASLFETVLSYKYMEREHRELQDAVSKIKSSIVSHP